MPRRSDGPSEQVPLKSITGEGLLRAVEAEAEALSIIHVRIQKQLQNLEVEGKLLQHMVHRVRSRHSEQELQEFDEQYVQEELQRQQQKQQQEQARRQAMQASWQPLEQHQQQEGQQQEGEQEGDQLQALLQQHPLLAQHRQHMQGFRRAAAEPQTAEQQHLPQQLASAPAMGHQEQEQQQE